MIIKRLILIAIFVPIIIYAVFAFITITLPYYILTGNDYMEKVTSVFEKVHNKILRK